MALTKVSTDGVKDDAITSGKIPANAVGASELADNAVDTNAIADDAVNFNKISHIDSGRLLGRVSGGLGQIETPNASQVRTLLNVADGANQTTINNNADNRLITGSGTANTLNGEANLTFSSSLLVTDSQGSVNVGGNYALLKRTSGTTNYIAAPNADAVLDISADETIRFGTVNTADFNSTERMRIDSSGRVKIATTDGSPHANADELTLGDPSGTVRSGMTINSGANKDGSIHFGDPDSNLSGQINYDHNGDCLRFYTANDKRVRIDSDGLKFGNDTAAANALGDYEEGSWTPDLRFGNGNTGMTYSQQIGKYIKIGAIVIARFGIKLTAKGSSTGSARILGLPFNGVHSSYYHDTGATTMVNGGTDSSGGHTLVFVTDSSKLAVRQGSFSNTNYDSTHTAFTNDTGLFGTVVYNTTA